MAAFREKVKKPLTEKTSFETEKSKRKSVYREYKSRNPGNLYQ